MRQDFALALLEKVMHTIRTHGWLQTDDRVVLAVSGGADSTALLDIMVRLSRDYLALQLAVACLDHGLRRESKSEFKQVQAMAAGYGLGFFRLPLQNL